jgi:hypothetical protein
MRISVFVVTGMVGLFTLATGYAAPAGDAAAEGDENEVRAGGAQEVFLPVSNLETSRTRSAKVAKLKLRGAAAMAEIARCHQYYLSGEERREIIVCRDGERELIMDAAYGDDFTRWARLRTPTGADQTFTCKQVSEQEFSRETYGGTTGHLCKPKGALTAQAKALFAAVDADPVIDEFPTRSVYLSTNWKKAQPETWASWSEKISRAVPVGEYTGFGSSSSKKCKVKIAKKGDGFEVSIHGLDDSGAETRTQARVELSSANSLGAIRKDGLPQKVASATRPATVLIASAETETRTDDYYARNVRIVRFPDAPASVDAGHTAIYIDDNYCQRLSPGLPAF